MKRKMVTQKQVDEAWKSLGSYLEGPTKIPDVIFAMRSAKYDVVKRLAMLAGLVIHSAVLAEHEDPEFVLWLKDHLKAVLQGEMDAPVRAVVPFLEGN